MPNDNADQIVVGVAIEEPSAADLAKQIQLALKDLPPPPRPSVSYLFALAIVAAGAVALPFIYILLSVALLISAAGVMYFWGPLVRSIWSATLVVGGAGGLAMAGFSLLAPLARRRGKRFTTPIVVSRASEPVLFALVDACAHAVRAGSPDEVHFTHEANAAITRDDGKTILILGLPLVACLTVRELAGLLGHELGHVRQGLARRLMVSVASVFDWFNAVVETANEDAAQGAEGTAEVVRSIALFLGLTLLRIQLWLGEAILVGLGRQMELDADRSEALIAGKQGFASTSQKLCAAHLAIEQAIVETLNGASFPENLPRYCADFVSGTSPGQRLRYARLLMKDAAGVPHPSYQARVDNVNQLTLSTPRLPDVSAQLLFLRFDAYSARVTASLASEVSIMKVGHRNR